MITKGKRHKKIMFLNNSLRQFPIQSLVCCVLRKSCLKVLFERLRLPVDFVNFPFEYIIHQWTNNGQPQK